ncbi:MAG: hypothetical protein WAU32_09515 [Thermoanaerobaculia bacterium]
MRALASGALGLLISAGALAITAGPVVHEYAVPSVGGAIQISGGSVELLIPEPSANAIARLSTDGTVIQRQLPAPSSLPFAIARESNSAGRIVFTQVGTNRIGVIDAGGVLAEYDIPTVDSNPRGIAAPGVIWFTEFDGNRIGRLNPGSPSPMLEYDVPTPNAGPFGIAVGPGSASNNYHLWFTEYRANKIGRIDDNGAITEYDIPTSDSGPFALVQVVQDGEIVMYFTESRANKIGRITSSGAITEYPIPTPNSGPSDIVVDADGVWFSEQAAGKLGRLSFDGEIQEFPLPAGTRPEGIAITNFNPDGSAAPTSIWYVDGTSRRVGRLSENRLYAVGAGHDETFDTDFELSAADGRPTRVRLGTLPQNVCPIACIDPGVVLDVPAQGSVTTSASHVPHTNGVELYMVTSERFFGIVDLPATRAWIVETGAGDVRLELPLVDYWSVADSQPSAAGGGHQPFLTFPARRVPGVRTGLVLAALETALSGGLVVRIEAILPDIGVVASASRQIFLGQSLVLTNVLADLRYFQNFEGEIRVTRQSPSGLFWGLAEILDGDRLTLLPPGSKLEQDCLVGPARCDPPRRTRIVTRP